MPFFQYKWRKLAPIFVMRNLLIFFALIISACQTAKPVSNASEAANPLLFTVGDSAIHANEFLYVYRKNNAQLDSAFTREDVGEYLGLYEDFKVKIMEAYARGYDTLAEYRNELATYTDQLKEPYLTESRITDVLMQEAFDRTREEIRASHILIRFPNNPSPEDTLKAYNKISTVQSLARQGLSFDSLAVRYSEDPSVGENGGDLGYFTSMQMVYPFESAAYSTPVGEISSITRTRFGYHILKVTDRRPATGKVVVSHIMLRQRADSVAVRNRIFEIHEMAKGGVEWDQLVKEYSEDVNSKSRGGVINPFGVGQAPLTFQEAAFSLSNPGDISDPVETQYGWHIIRLVEKRPLPDFDELKSSIERRISQDERARLGKEYLVERLKAEWGYSEDPGAMDMVAALADSASSEADYSKRVFSIGDKQVTLKDFMTYLEADSAESTAAPKIYLAQQYEEFKSGEIMRWEEVHLEEKYPEYRMLLREYREGILYFKLMEEEIWNRASEDSVGQRAFYESHKDRYRGEPWASATVYAMRDSASASFLESEIRNNTDVMSRLDSLSASLETTILPVEVSWERGDNSPWQEIPQEIGVYCENIMDKWYVVEVTDVNPDGLRPFARTRGQVISDYQQYLEKEWVKQLKEKYPVKRNEKGVAFIYEELVQ